MLNLVKFKKRLLICAAALTLAACGGGGGGGGATTTPPASATLLQGKILDASGQPIAGATVSGAGVSTQSTSDGSYELRPSGSLTSAVLLVKKQGFATAAKEVPVVSGSAITVNLNLLADQLSTTFSAGAGLNVAVAGANVQIPANGLQTAAGAAYTGTVSIGASYYSPDTLAGVQAFAQPYSGTDAGQSALLLTVGFIEVKLTDASGAGLQLKSTTPATLTFPASSVSAGTASVPLWYYDEAAATWVREGQATKQANGSYQGTVKHFTIWNADVLINAASQATLKGCFVGSNGQPVLQVAARVRTNGWSAYRSILDGTFQTPVPAGLALEVVSALTTPAFTAVAVPALASGEVRQLPCIVITNPPANPYGGFITSFPTLFTSTATPVTPTAPTTPTPTVPSPTPTTPTPTPTTPTPTPTTPVTTTTAAYAGTYSGTFSGGEAGTFTVAINSAGVVTGTGRSTTFNLDFGVSGAVNASGAVTLNAASGTAGASTFTGTINATTGAVAGTWTRTGANGTFTGQRL